MKPKLFCFPYAGGMAENYRNFFRHLSGFCEPVGLEYAGHGRRGQEPLYPGWQSMLEDTARQINEMLTPGEPYFCLGYSMGSLVLHDVLAEGMLSAPPAHVFLCAHTPVGVPRASYSYHQLSDEEFLEKMRALGGMDRVDSRMMANRIFRRLYFNPMRHDFRLLGERAELYVQVTSSLDIPATVFYSPDDTPPQLICRWNDFFALPPAMFPFEGHHFFIWEHGEEMAHIILRRIAADIESNTQ